MMKKFLALCLLVSILGQGCKVYQNTPVSIEDAVSKGPVKVVDSEYDHWNFETIILKDSTYYGITGGKVYQQIELNPDELISIKVIDPTKTKSANSVLMFTTAILVVSAVLVILAVTFCC